MRTAPALLAVVATVTACGPAPSVPPPATAPATAPAASASPVAALPPVGVVLKIPIENVLALAPARDGAWYAAPGSVGLVGPTGRTRSAAAGPRPVAVAATERAVYLVEGRPETTELGAPRTDRLERLDPATLEVTTSAPLVADVTAAAVGEGFVWTLDVDGRITAWDEETLEEAWHAELGGRGPGTVVAGESGVWTSIGDLSGTPQYILGHVVADPAPRLATSTVKGSGVGPTLASGERTWLAVADDPVYDWLYEVAPDGTLGEPSFVPAPEAMDASEGFLWWAASDGSVGAIFEATGGRTGDASIAANPTSVAAHGRKAYVGSEAGILLFVIPAQAGGSGG